MFEEGGECGNWGDEGERGGKRGWKGREVTSPNPLDAFGGETTNKNIFSEIVKNYQLKRRVLDPPIEIFLNHCVSKKVSCESCS